LLGWRPGVATVALPFASGALLDALLGQFGAIHGAATRVVAVIVASCVMGLGGVLMVRAAIGFTAYDGIMLRLHSRTNRPLAAIRLAMEAIALVAGWILGGPVGIGTVITGVLIGPSMQLWFRVTSRVPLLRASRASPANLAPAPLR
ncbi:MAG TPA: hypothetical protein VFR41_07345, partial [Acidimicrobiia bacterium]|nr:hypothetical protein [Acidimicrobiia bacterium]